MTPADLLTDAQRLAIVMAGLVALCVAIKLIEREVKMRLWGRSKRPAAPDLRNEDYGTLTGDEKRRVDAAIDEVKRTGKPASHAHGGDEFYAYPHASGGTSWGINAPLNTKRGVK
jgi:hypothetical protein